MSIFKFLKCVAKLLAKRVVPNASWLLKVRLTLIQDQHMCYIKLTVYQLVRNKTSFLNAQNKNIIQEFNQHQSCCEWVRQSQTSVLFILVIIIKQIPSSGKYVGTSCGPGPRYDNLNSSFCPRTCGWTKAVLLVCVCVYMYMAYV